MLDSSPTTASRPTCNILLFVATPTERAALERVAGERSIPFTEIEGQAATYIDLGAFGMNRVMAVHTGIGPLFGKGSTALAVSCRAETSATGIICVGMAFGVDRTQQQRGDILVSEHILPYDDRRVVCEDGGEPRYEYEGRAHARAAKPSLLAMMKRAAAASRSPTVHFGSMLSGAARIECGKYRDALIAGLASRPGTIVGGEMEGVGLLVKKKLGIVVKAICDFGDEKIEDDQAVSREDACVRSVEFVLDALAAR